MGVISISRAPQYSGILYQNVTSATTWTDLYSGDFWDALTTTQVPVITARVGTAPYTAPGETAGEGVRFTYLRIQNVGSVAQHVIWSADYATMVGKTNIDVVSVPAGATVEFDVEPYSTVDPTDPSIVYGPRRLGIRADTNLDFTATGIGTGANLSRVRIEAGFLGV